LLKRRKRARSDGVAAEPATQEWSLSAETPRQGNTSTSGLHWVEPPLPRSEHGSSPHYRILYAAFVKVIQPCSSLP